MKLKFLTLLFAASALNAACSDDETTPAPKAKRGCAWCTPLRTRPT